MFSGGHLNLSIQVTKQTQYKIIQNYLCPGPHRYPSVILQIGEFKVELSVDGSAHFLSILNLRETRSQYWQGNMTSYHQHNLNLLISFQASREVIRRYLLEFRLKATHIYEEFCKNNVDGLNCMPTLLQILNHMEPLKYEIETIASIYKLIDTGNDFFLLQ